MEWEGDKCPGTPHTWPWRCALGIRVCIALGFGDHWGWTPGRVVALWKLRLQPLVEDKQTPVTPLRTKTMAAVRKICQQQKGCQRAEGWTELSLKVKEQVDDTSPPFPQPITSGSHRSPKHSILHSLAGSSVLRCFPVHTPAQLSSIRLCYVEGREKLFQCSQPCLSTTGKAPAETSSEHPFLLTGGPT